MPHLPPWMCTGRGRASWTASTRLTFVAEPDTRVNVALPEIPFGPCGERWTVTTESRIASADTPAIYYETVLTLGYQYAVLIAESPIRHVF